MRSLTAHRVQCNSNFNTDRLRDRVKQARKTLLAERKRIESQRTDNFKSLCDSVKKLVNEEITFVKDVCLTTAALVTSEQDKPSDAFVEDPVVDEPATGPVRKD